MKKYSVFLLAGLFTVFTACQNNKSVEEIEKQDPEAAKADLFSKVYSEDNLKSQLFQIHPLRDTSITSENGTLYRLYGNSFEFLDGTKISTPIEIEIKEALKPFDFVMANLTTLSSDHKILESGGMLYIHATSKGQPLQIKKDKEIGIMLPENTICEDMSIYEGNKKDDQLFWSNPEPVMNSKLKTLERSYTTITYYHYGSENATKEEHAKVSEWLWKKGRKIGDKEKVGQSNIHVIALAKNLEVLKESANGVFMQEVITHKGQNGFVEDYNTSYIFSVKKLGWANIDRLFSDPKSKEVDFIVAVGNSEEFGYVYTSLLLPEHKVYLPGYQKKEGTYSFSHGDSEKMVLPTGAKATILATAYKGDKPYYCIKSFQVSDKVNLTMSLKEISLKELKQELEKKI
jgi:hypothetical protein